MLSSKEGVAALSVGLNAALVLLKLVVGFAIGSVSVVSEAIHSGIDLLASFMALFAVRTSSKPPDREHHFGHGKIESLVGAVEAVLIFLAAFLIVAEAIQKLKEGTGLETVDLGIVVMVVSTLGNLVVARLVMRVARSTDSVALEADGWHHATDVLTSLGVALGLVAVRLTGHAELDALVAIGVAVVISKAAYDITRRSLGDLLDASLPEKEQEEIRKVLDVHAHEVAEMVDYHQVRSRKSGSDRYVDMHLVVKRDATVKESHELCDHLESELQEAIGPVSLNIHVEPCDDDCEKCDSNGDESHRTGSCGEAEEATGL